MSDSPRVNIDRAPVWLAKTDNGTPHPDFPRLLYVQLDMGGDLIGSLGGYVPKEEHARLMRLLGVAV